MTELKRKPKTRTSSLSPGVLGGTFTSYRNEHDLTQEDLAFNLSIDVRTLAAMNAVK